MLPRIHDRTQIYIHAYVYTNTTHAQKPFNASALKETVSILDTVAESENKSAIKQGHSKSSNFLFPTLDELTCT